MYREIEIILLKSYDDNLRTYLVDKSLTDKELAEMFSGYIIKRTGIFSLVHLNDLFKELKF